MLLLVRTLLFLCGHFRNQFMSRAKLVIILWSLSWLMIKIYDTHLDHTTQLTRFDPKWLSRQWNELQPQRIKVYHPEAIPAAASLGVPCHRSP